MKQYIIPANSKKSQLIFGLFRWIDLGILGFGILLSFAFLLAIDGDGLMTMFIKFLPLLLSVFLVFPVPYYHNVMEFMRDIYGEVGVQVMLEETKKKNSVNVKSQKYAENWLPIRGIQNGEIILENGYRVTGVKVRPRNIFILDYTSQDNAIMNLRNFYNTIDYPFWLMVADRPVDINVYLSQLKLLFNSVQYPAIRKLIREDIDKANLFMSREVNVTDTEYFILFKDRRPEIIQKRIQNLVSGLASAGLQSAQVSNDDLRVLLDGFMNGGETSNFGTVMSQ